MQFSNLLSLILLVVGCQVPEQQAPFSNAMIEREQLTVRADSLVLHAARGLVFYKGQPFTGTSEAFFPNGKKAIVIQYEKGKKDGAHIKWFDSGVKSFEAY